MAKITSFGLIANTAVGSGSAGGTSFSGPIDLRDANGRNNFSLFYKVGVSGAVGTAATVNFNYVVSNTIDGTYVTPINGDKGTIGTAGSGADGSCSVLSFNPIIAPWMKIKSIAGTSGTANVSLDLHVQ